MESPAKCSAAVAADCARFKLWLSERIIQRNFQLLFPFIFVHFGIPLILLVAYLAFGYSVSLENEWLKDIIARAADWCRREPKTTEGLQTQIDDPADTVGISADSGEMRNDMDRPTVPSSKRKNSSKKPPIHTPWGKVRGDSPPHSTPANVLESQIKRNPTPPASSFSSAIPNNEIDEVPPGLGTCDHHFLLPTPPPSDSGIEHQQKPTRRTWTSVPYRRNWIRGEVCERLHDQGHHLHPPSQECTLRSVWEY